MSAQPPKVPPTARERARNFLLYGFLISVALHLLIGPFVKFERAPDEPERIETVKIDKMPTPPPTPKPTPTPHETPTPPPTPPPPKSTPEPQKPQQVKIKTLDQSSKTTGESTEQTNVHTEGSVNGAPEGTATGAPTAAPVVATPAPPPPSPTPAPTPTATPTPSCKNPDVPPRVVQAAQPDTPPIAQQQGITGQVEVIITLDANSKQTSPPTVRKSPSRILNAAAIDAARQSRFQTEIKGCTPIASQYLFIVEFTNQ